MPSTQPSVVAKLANMRNLVLKPHVFFESIEKGSVLEAAYFLLIIAAVVSLAEVIGDDTLTADLMRDTFLKMSFVFVLLLNSIAISCTLLAGLLVKVLRRGVQVPKPTMKLREGYIATAFTLTPLFLFGVHSITLSICALLLSAALGTIAIKTIYNMPIKLALPVELASFGFTLAVTFVAFFAPMYMRGHSVSEAEKLKGTEAPNITLQVIGGNAISVKEAAAKGVMVMDFWSTKCPPCLIGLPKISRAVSRFKDQGVQFYAVCMDAGEKSYLDEKQFGATAVTCTEAGYKAYKVDGFPETLVIDKSGVVRSCYAGVPYDEENRIAQDIQDALTQPAAKP